MFSDELLNAVKWIEKVLDSGEGYWDEGFGGAERVDRLTGWDCQEMNLKKII